MKYLILTAHAIYGSSTEPFKVNEALNTCSIGEL